MKTKTTIFYILFILISIKVYCQQKEYIYFDSIYNCNNVDYSCAFTSYEINNGYITAGISEDAGNLNVIYILRTNKQGNQIEIKNYGRTNCHLWPGVAGSFIKTTDGGYALGGGVTSSLNDKALLVKFDANGDTLWTKEYGDNVSGSFWTARQCKQTWDKGFILVGEKYLGNHNTDFLLIKTDSAGNLKWQKTLGGTDLEMGWSIVVTPDSGFFIGGYKWIWNTEYSYDALVFKTDSLGNVQWQKEFGGDFDDGAAIVNVAKDSNYIVGFAYATAQPYPTECADYRFNILKLNTNGDVVWNKKYADVRFCSDITNINVLDDSKIIVAGYGNPYTTNGGNAWRKGMILKIGNNGDSIWMRDYERVHYLGSENKIYCLQQTSDNGFIACGEVAGGPEPPNGQNMWLLKMDSTGCLVPNCDGVNIVEPLVNNKGELKIYPNPAQDKININLPGFENLAGLRLNIYNIQGQLLLQQDLEQNNTETDISQLGSGVYIVKIKLNNGSVVQAKFVVVR